MESGSSLCDTMAEGNAIVDEERVDVDVGLQRVVAPHPQAKRAAQRARGA